MIHKWFFILAVSVQWLFSYGLKAQDSPAIHMRTTRQIAVYPTPSRAQNLIGRIHFGAVLKIIPTPHFRGCKKGWGRLADGRYVCTSYLIETTSAVASSPEDNPDIDEGIVRYVVTNGGAVSYKNKHQFQHRKPWMFLYRGTVLAVKRVIERGGTKYLVTRDGHFVHGKNVQKMNPIWRLGKRVSTTEDITVGYIININASIYAKASDDAEVVGEMSQFEEVISTSFLGSNDGWVQLPGGGFVRDKDIARVREAKTKFQPALDEKWIAVDLQEQVVSAYVGMKRVYVTLASTGKKGNTEPGVYRVKWKRRMQTMNLYGGHFRVDDVQWVMYYIPSRGFALHTAWHRNFGHPVSHGCVNLPRDDARWLYEWASPVSAEYESENLHSPVEKGTRVIVYQ